MDVFLQLAIMVTITLPIVVWVWWRQRSLVELASDADLTLISSAPMRDVLPHANSFKSLPKHANTATNVMQKDGVTLALDASIGREARATVLVYSWHYPELGMCIKPETIFSRMAHRFDPALDLNFDHDKTFSRKYAIEAVNQPLVAEFFDDDNRFQFRQQMMSGYTLEIRLNTAILHRFGRRLGASKLPRVHREGQQLIDGLATRAAALGLENKPMTS
jgi:hypothetical protein